MDFLQSNLYFTMTIAGIVLVSLLTIGLIFAKLYRRASKEIAFVRTGLGGEKVVKDGGAIVLPVLHEVMPVRMNTLRIEVSRIQKSALITKDRMRVDVKAEFYLRVSPTTNGISMAAQTLGSRTMHVEEVKSLMEGKFVDVLRAVAAEMTMTEMHEQRTEFVQRVQGNVSNDLDKNGLELESVSLTGFDQTQLEYFDESNAFDAEGRARLTRIIEDKRRETNDIQQENRVAIEKRNLEAEKLSLDISKNQQQATLDQQRELEFAQADQKAKIEAQNSEKEREAEVAAILKERAVAEAKIEKDKFVQQQEIEKQKTLEQARIDQQQAIREKDIEQQRAVEVAEQNKQIAIAEKSEEESAARTKAATEENKKVAAEQNVITTRDVAEANRRKEIEVIEARQEAERNAVGIQIAAQAEKEAATNRAEAITTEAKAEAEAKRIQADADERVYEVDAQGKQGLYEAENALRDEQIELQKALAVLKALPQIIEHSVKPMENIDSIKILQGYGAGQQGATGNDAPGTANQGGMAEQMTQAALAYRANAPMVDAMLQEIGLVNAGGTLTDLIAQGPQMIKEPAPAAKV